jgi:nitrogen fixation NifU-like protein
MGSLEDLYQDIILDHHRNPRHCERIEGAHASSKGINPQCGDEIEIQLKLENGNISKVGFRGQGCAISRASASLLCDSLVGKSIEEATQAAQAVLADFHDPSRPFTFKDEGELAALDGVRPFPGRRKCATLAWEALEETIRKIHTP